MGCLLWCSIAQGKEKVGVIDFQEIYNNMPEAQQAEVELQAYFNQTLRELQERKANWEEMMAAVEKDTSAIGIRKRKLVEAEGLKIQEKEQMAQQEFESRKEMALKPIYDKVKQAIADVAKEQGLTLVLYSEQTAYFSETINITAAVKRKLGIKQQ